MKSVLKFMDDHLGYILVIPALLLIVLFSLVPIVESVRYSFFDYQLNDQQKNKMFLTKSYNLDLTKENIDYVEFYLSQEIEVASTDTTKMFIRDVIERTKVNHQAILDELKQEEGIVVISNQQYDLIKDFNQQVQRDIDAIYEIEGENFGIEADIKAVVDNLDETIIDNNFIGFDNFLWYHRLEGFNTLCWIITIIGVMGLFFDKLKILLIILWKNVRKRIIFSVQFMKY